MKMLNKSLSKSKSASKDSSSDGEDQERPLDSQSDASPNPQESDLFSFLSSMHLSGGSVSLLPSPNIPNLNNGAIISAAAAQVYASRKRKFLDGNSSSVKLFGSSKPSVFCRSIDDDPLHTPQCSQTGYDDEDSESNTDQGSNQRSRLMLPPDGGHNLIGDIDENLAADFDGSLSGLGVDMNSGTYSMNEALLALPTLSMNSNSMFKHELSNSSTNIRHVSGPSSLGCSGKNDHLSSPSTKSRSTRDQSGSPSNQSFDVLDLSTDEAVNFQGSDTSQDHILGPKSFAGTVSRELSRHTTPSTDLNQLYNLGIGHHHGSSQSLHSNFSSSQPNLNMMGIASGHCNDLNTFQNQRGHHPLQSSTSSLNSLHSRKDSKEQAMDGSLLDLPNASRHYSSSKFEYTLSASTSIATKVNEASITYLNQGQPYELSLRKIADSCGSHGKRFFKCVIRICFHERRLQYMEQEQIIEWSAKHVGERILDLDLPLSYGILEATRDPRHLNLVSFKWDPSRDTGAYIKVNCISTEFTPKKHGGEKGVPFRLQVETFDSEDNRIHAANCILQVFKLKGADRKHKQDRDKVHKRTAEEQEKFAKPYEKTLLNEIPLEQVFTPQTSRPVSPKLEPVVNISSGGTVEVLPTRRSRSATREDSGAIFFTASSSSSVESNLGSREALNGSSRASGHMNDPPAAIQQGVLPNIPLCLTALSSVEAVTQWLGRNRFGHLLQNFRNYNGRDLLRLSKDDLVSVCGLSEGIRLYNDIHMAPVAPRMTLYIAMKDGQEYDAIYLENPTLADLTKNFAHAVGLQPSVLCNMYKKISPQGILIRITDAVVRNTPPESMFIFSLKDIDENSCQQERLNVILEEANFLNHAGHKNSVTSCDSFAST